MQLSTFGRPLAGQADALVRFEPALARIEDRAVAASAAARIMRMPRSPAIAIIG